MCFQFIKHLYRVCWFKTRPKCTINHLSLEGEPIKIKTMLTDNNTDTEKTLSEGGNAEITFFIDKANRDFYTLWTLERDVLLQNFRSKEIEY